MSEQPLTYEGVLEMFRETWEQSKKDWEQSQAEWREIREQMKDTDRKFEETDRRIKETDQQIKATSREVGKLSSRVGEIIENMVGGGNIIDQFCALGHHVIAHSRNKHFGKSGDEISGEIDLLLEDGDIAILVEVKTTLKTDDVLEHIERLEKYRLWVDANKNDHKRYIGAVAGAVVEDNVVKFAQKKGLYVIVQSGIAFEIVTPPKKFKAKKW